jgi:predicted GNAT superfamily acetyltransferase
LRTEQVQRDAWGIKLPESVIPFHIMIAAQHHGGLVLGAYDGKRMVGCLFGISGHDNTRQFHYSHITGVLRDYQKRGVGLLLKKRQRELVLNDGMDLVKWTFDPLQAGNAYFNIRKLGATAREYHRDLYGQMRDTLNKGMISDRFEAEWWIKTRRVDESLRGKRKHLNAWELKTSKAELVNETDLEEGIRRPVKLHINLKMDRLLYEVPSRIDKVKALGLDLARKWTLHNRRAFENYFAKKYVATDVLLDHGKDETRVYYLLEQGFRPEKS